MKNVTHIGNSSSYHHLYIILLGLPYVHVLEKYEIDSKAEILAPTHFRDNFGYIGRIGGVARCKDQNYLRLYGMRVNSHDSSVGEAFA